MSNEEIKTARSYIGRLMDEYATAREADNISAKIEFNNQLVVKTQDCTSEQLTPNIEVESGVQCEIRDTSIYEEMRQVYAPVVDKRLDGLLKQFSFLKVAKFKLEESYKEALLLSKNIEQFESKVSQIKQQASDEISTYLRGSGVGENEILFLTNEIIDAVVANEINRIKEHPNNIVIKPSLMQELELSDDIRVFSEMLSSESKRRQPQQKHRDAATIKRRKANKLASKQRRKKK